MVSVTHTPLRQCSDCLETSNHPSGSLDGLVSGIVMTPPFGTFKTILGRRHFGIEIVNNVLPHDSEFDAELLLDVEVLWLELVPLLVLADWLVLVDVDELTFCEEDDPELLLVLTLVDVLEPELEVVDCEVDCEVD